MQPVTAVSFGRWLKERRKLLDLTQDQLARKVGCALITIKKLEADERRPSRQIAERLLEVLAIPEDDQVAFLRLARGMRRDDQVASRGETPLLPANAFPLSGSDHRSIRGYDLREPIGSGSFGAVYRAYQPVVGRDVAIKIVLPEYANHSEFIRCFEAEAQVIARLEHPHIVPLYDYWREPNGAYLVMPWIRGGDLRAALGAGPWALNRSARLLEQLAAALAYAHRQNIVHRDIKPANILLHEERNAYIADFGIAASLAHPPPDGAPPHTPLARSIAYRAPEQLRDEPITPRTDVYSLGMVLYEVLTGEHPFGTTPPTNLLWSASRFRTKRLQKLLPFDAIHSA